MPKNNDHGEIENIQPATRAPTRVRKEALLFSADLLACAASFALALVIRFSGEVPASHIVPYATYLPVLVSIRLLMASLFGLYDFRHRLTAADHTFGAIGAAFSGVGVGYLLLASIQLYYTPATELSRLVGMIDLGLMTAWFAVSRALVLGWLRWSGFRMRVVLVGPVEACRGLSEEIRKHAPQLLDVAGIIAPDGENIDDEEVLGSLAGLQSILTRERIDQIVLTQVDLPQEGLHAMLAHCDRHSAELFLYPDLDVSALASTSVMSIAGLPLVALTPAFGAAPYRFGKRLLDVLTAAAVLALSLPLCLFAALAVKLGSRGPVFFSQERVGLYGRSLRVIKFRTMVLDAEANSGPTLSEDNDPRVTGVGRFLRRTRVDEIPQLWNVLRGEMSLVGPRPERREFVERFIEETPLYERRLLVKPGLTGLAQIHGRYDTDYAQKLRYDLIYINSLSLTADLRILLATIRTVVTGKGAR